ncbi:hypothetical protein H0E87_029521 [Populus deltoides]|uniref:Uncharacterized protein n=1 Tax=Populus deltoides TaxID=3696 RepID=A0A8T2WMJ2_POPDE|nr:hypothetical protein H0E87_029521 [Populus deltoides]
MPKRTWKLKNAQRMDAAVAGTRFKGTATLGSRGDYRYPDELARWTKSFRESASESQGKTRAGMMPFVMLNGILYNFRRDPASSCLQEAACGKDTAAHPL